MVKGLVDPVVVEKFMLRVWNGVCCQPLGDGTEGAYRDLMNRGVPDHASLTSTDRAGRLRRLAYVGYLGGVALCSGMAFVAVCRGELGCLGLAGASGVFALGLRAFLRGRSATEWIEGEMMSSGIESEFRVEAEGLTARAEELAKLLRTWNEMERSRGTLRFDAWAWQSLRAELRKRLREDLELRRLLGLGE